MARNLRPVFLERRGYRRRRLTDGARLVFVAGAILWMIPLIWPDGRDPASSAVPMSSALFYVFGVWLLLIVLSACLSGLLTVRDPDREAADEDDRSRP